MPDDIYALKAALALARAKNADDAALIASQKLVMPAALTVGLLCARVI